MRLESIEEVKRDIRDYFQQKPDGHPFFVNTENYRDFYKLSQDLGDSDYKRLFLSDYANGDGFPDNSRVVADVSGTTGCFVVIGISQYFRLLGDEKLKKELILLSMRNYSGKVLFLLEHCQTVLQELEKSDPRYKEWIVLATGVCSVMPKIFITQDVNECAAEQPISGIQFLLRKLEAVNDEKPEAFTVVTKYADSFIQSGYCIDKAPGIYLSLKSRYPELSNIEKSFLSDDDWARLAGELGNYISWDNYSVAQFGHNAGLINSISQFFSGERDQYRQVIFLSALKIAGVGNNYLQRVLNRISKAIDFETCVYFELMDIDADDDIFAAAYKERKELLALLPERGELIKEYCERLTVKGAHAVCYITDRSEIEEKYLLQWISEYDEIFENDHIKEFVFDNFPLLRDYEQNYVFSELNMQLPVGYEVLRENFTEYFCQYKWLKIKNTITEEFKESVRQNAIDQNFSYLPTRSKLLMNLDRDGMRCYFFDALGAEHLGFIMARCKVNGLVVKIQIGHAELPSITSMNSEFVKEGGYFYNNYSKIDDLDELKHKGKKYDYQLCKLPIHLFEELRVIDKTLKDIKNRLLLEESKKAVIVSDHGASRLAVICERESQSQLRVLDEKGQHGGRCCPIDSDPQIEFAVFENGYSVLANYDRFKGSRRSEVEVHGGATLEEILVPVIELSLIPKDRRVELIKNIIELKTGEFVVLMVNTNWKIEKPAVLIGENRYAGNYKDNYNIEFVTDIKRQGDYEAVLCDGENKVSEVMYFKVCRMVGRVKAGFGDDLF